MFDTGNPWIFLGLSISLPVKIHTHGPQVWILMGLAQGTVTGTKSMDTGMDFYTRRDTMNFFYYAMMDQSSSDQTSSFFASGKDAAAGMWGTGTGMDMDQETLILIRTRGTHIHQPAGFPIPVSNTIRKTMDVGLWGWLGGRGKDAQIMVKKFSSKCYTSHRMVPKVISVALDT